MVHLIQATSAAPQTFPEPLTLGAVSLASAFLALMVRIKITVEIHVPSARRRRKKK